jgi:hypothetical protein
MKIKIYLASALFILGLLYLAIEKNIVSFQNKSTPMYNTVYAVTGNNGATVEILKCLDKKSIQNVVDHQETVSNSEVKFTAECLNDWFDEEIHKSQINN